ncbi:hypothetical protein BpHYR1_000617 [Brachionus plicatilis]|uniref:Uncharacterized protein n=1 Tax=Brachionus plicatilis TaxID=10195 RepID=A0A3M7R5T2_BRAPC|nr:hypothetical protein BpHYR1_000617 [Brachionus plicatilis]
MMYPDTDSSNTTSSDKIEPSSEETYEVAPRQTRPISHSECYKTSLIQQTVKNSRGKNRSNSKHYLPRLRKMDKSRYAKNSRGRK